MLRSGNAPTKKVAKFVYDYAKHGGAIGDVSVQGNGIPADAIIIDGLVDVETGLVGSGAIVAVKAKSADDVLAATAITSLALNDLLDTVPDGSAANAIRLTSAINELTLTISDAALTAGKISVALEYY
jgi:hypothetical protein